MSTRPSRSSSCVDAEPRRVGWDVLVRERALGSCAGDRHPGQLAGWDGSVVEHMEEGGADPLRVCTTEMAQRALAGVTLTSGMM